MRSFAGNAEIPPMELSEATKKVMDDVRRPILLKIRHLTRMQISDRLDVVFKEFGGGAFVKLSTRRQDYILNIFDRSIFDRFKQSQRRGVVVSKNQGDNRRGTWRE